MHWHGLRLDYRYDGTPQSQRPIAIGGSFTYELDFPDPGVYWYHPHIREDYGQEMGLYLSTTPCMRKPPGKIPGTTVAARLKMYAAPMPSAISVNM